MKKTIVVFILSFVFLISLGFMSAISIGGCSNDLDCPASTECVHNYCDIANGICASAQLSGNSCEGDGTCSNGICSHSSTCDDNNVCTIDSGSSLLSCRHTPIDCSDGDSSTYDWCLSDIGCQNTLQPACYDEDPCTIVQYLSFSCNIVDYSEFCDDNDPLTDDSCDLSSQDPTQWGCIHTPTPPLVPEFGTFMILLTALGAVGIFFVVRREIR